MDVSDTLAPTSDQLDAIDLHLTGPKTFTIKSVSKGNVEQPVQVHLVEFPRVWRPSKGMRRVLAAAWGVESSAWVGRRVTLYCDPNVTFGKERTGGVRISHMTDLKGGKKLDVPLLISRGKSAIYTVQPLTEPAARAAIEPTAEQVTACTDVDELRAMWGASSAARREQIEARVAELIAADAPGDQPGGDDWPETAPPADAGTGEA